MVYEKKSANKTLRIFCLLAGDILLINLAAFLAVILRFGLAFSRAPVGVVNSFYLLAPLATILGIMIFAAMKLYRSLWEYASVAEISYIFLACILNTVAYWLLGLITGYSMPKGVYVIYFLLLTGFIMCFRFTYRFARILRSEVFALFPRKKQRRAMLIGAGDAGSILLREYELNRATAPVHIVCVIDDDKNKIGSYVRGIKVVGGRDTIIKNAKKYRVDEIIFALPSAGPEVRAEVLNICKQTGCQLKTLPGITQILEGEIKISKLRDVRIEDLLGREPIDMHSDNVMQYVENHTVLVTGGGGSIGSELCRQIALHHPKLLVIFDIYENNIYQIQNELKRNYGDALPFVSLIGSVRDSRRVEQVFQKYKPDIVFHAAAHKHVPLMEDSPNEAIKNNVFGTLKVSNASIRHGVKRFVLISTDKAVNPTNIMGASKRICEMIVQSANRRSSTEFVAVRFGNVLGSNGSVIPLFQKQIAAGGPVTVTDPNIIRYFMTIPEAVSLVLQAGAQAKGGEIFVLDMGAPVKILELAENLIRLSGHVPYVDIDIRFTGLRPGEKLYEELLMKEEGLQNTENLLIHIGKPIEFNEEEFQLQLSTLYQAMMDDNCNIRALVQTIVPTFHAEDSNTQTQPSKVQPVVQTATACVN